MYPIQSNGIRSGNQELGFRKGEYRIAKEEDCDCARNIVTAYTHSSGSAASSEEIDYIATYLYLSSQWIDSNYIQLLIISMDNDTAKGVCRLSEQLVLKSEITPSSALHRPPMKRT